MTALRYLLILLFSLSFLPSQSQGLKETFAYGMHLMEIGSYDEAIYSFQRVIYFDEKEEYILETYPEIAYAYLQMGDYPNAAKYFDLAYFSAKTREEKLEMGIQKAVALIYNKEFPLAIVDLFDLPYGNDPEFDFFVDFYLGIAYYGMRDFESAEKHFSTAAIFAEGEQGKEMVRQIFEQVEKTERLKPGKARWMSLIIPGLGQFYAGNTKSGINSLLLNTGFVLLAASVTINYTWLDAAVSVGPWLQRYWSGGSKNAERGAISKKEKRRAAHYQDLMAVFEKSQKN